MVQFDKLGQAQTVAPALANYHATDPQVAWHLARFIEQVRSVPADPIVLRQNWLDAYQYVTDKGYDIRFALEPRDRRDAAQVRNALLAAVLAVALLTAVAVFSEREQREVEERLRGLGYLE